MTDYAFDFAQATTELLPPSKRNRRIEAYLNLFSSQYQRLHDIVFTKYYLGSTYPDFNGATAYINGDRVKDANYGIYELVDSTAVISVLGVNTNPHTNASAWTQICPDYRGVFARSRYNAQKLVLEYVLNEYFGTVFRQPNSPTTPTPSDIWISEIKRYNPWFIARDANKGSPVIDAEYFAQGYIIDDDTFPDQWVRSIHVPDSGGSSLPGWWTGFNAGGDGEKKIRAIVDQYNIAGCYYRVQTW
jgi:hypothetical protein